MATLRSLSDWARSDAAGRWARWAAAVALVGFVVDLCLVYSGDFNGYLQVGRAMLAGRHIYADTRPGLNTWPPFFSLFCVPLALLAWPTPYLARVVWVVANLVALVLIVDLLARLVYGRSLRLRAYGLGLAIWSPALAIPLLLTSRWLISNLTHLQVNLIVLALVLGGLFLQANRREITGGILIGLAAALKVMPVLLIPYLAYRRRWRPALAALGAATAFSLSPMLVLGPARFWDYVLSWRAALERGWGVGRMNQSVPAMLDRLIGHGFVPLATPGRDGVPISGDPLVTIAVVAVIAAVVLVAAWAFRGDVEPAGWAALAEWSAVLVASAILGPVTWKAYLVVLLLPATLLFAVWRSSALDPVTRRAAGATLVVSYVLGGLTTSAFVGRKLAMALEMSSVVSLSALVVLVGVLWLRVRLGAHPTLSAATVIADRTPASPLGAGTSAGSRAPAG